MLVLAAPDKFRGTLAAADAARAVTEGALRAGWHCRELPLADGGEGTLDVLGGPNRVTRGSMRSLWLRSHSNRAAGSSRKMQVSRFSAPAIMVRNLRQ